MSVGGLSATVRRAGAAAAASALLLLAGAGCSGGSDRATSTPTTTATVTVDGPHVADRADGIQLVLPAGWQRVSFGSDTHAQLTRLLHDETQVRSIEEQIQVGQSRGLRILAVQPRPSGTADRMTVAVTPPAAGNLSGIQAQLVLTTAKIAATPPAFDHVTLPAGEALRVRYRLDDGENTAQYYVLVGGLSYALTVTSQSQLQLPLFDAVARTLRVGAA